MSLLLGYHQRQSTWSEIRIDFRSSGTSSGATNWNTVAGNPHSSVLTTSNMIDSTGAATTVDITTIATANWVAFSGGTSNNSVNGITGGTAFSGNGASNAIYQSIIFNYGTVAPARYDSTKPQFKLTGLEPNTSYNIKVAGDQGTLGFDAQNSSFRASATTTSTVVELNSGPGGGGGNTSVTTSATLTATSSATGELFIWMNTSASSANGTSNLAVICGMVITP